MTKYTILSIGPIYETIKQADNTRGVWTVSFMFSYLMRETIISLRNKLHIDDNDFVVPSIDEDFKRYLNDGNRAGLFHDRLILCKDLSEDIYDAYSNAVESLSYKILSTFYDSEGRKYTSKTVSEVKVLEYFRSYFQSYIAVMSVPDGDNPILALSPYVDAVEYEPRLALHEEEEYLHDFLRLTNLGDKNLKWAAFMEDSKVVKKDRCFKSLPEISAWELIREKSEEWKKSHLCLKIDSHMSLQNDIKNPETETDEIIKMLEKEFSSNSDECKSESKNCFKPYHKYVAMVQADGDGFGQYLEKIGSNTDELQQFSTDIFSFADESRKIIEKYGGAVVMVGGDDLLFFSPVVTDQINIFTLIREIDEKFKSIFGTNNGLSMSYGVSISYYKFPLQEALDTAYDSLIYKSKKSIWVNKNESMEDMTSEKAKTFPAKNAIHVNIRKHSGQSHSITLAKNTKLYEDFLLLLENELSPDKYLHLPHSLHHALRSAKEIIEKIDSDGVKNFFDNQFDEEVHKVKFKESLRVAREMIQHLKTSEDMHYFLTQYVDNEQNEKWKIPCATEILFSTLSTIKLLRGDA